MAFGMMTLQSMWCDLPFARRRNERPHGLVLCGNRFVTAIVRQDIGFIARLSVRYRAFRSGPWRHMHRIFSLYSPSPVTIRSTAATVASYITSPEPKMSKTVLL